MLNILWLLNFYFVVNLCILLVHTYIAMKLEPRAFHWLVFMKLSRLMFQSRGCKVYSQYFDAHISTTSFRVFFYWWIIFFMVRSLNLWDCWIDAKIIIGIFNVKKDIWMMCALHLNPFGLDLKNKSREMPWTKAIKVPNYGNVKTCIPFL